MDGKGEITASNNKFRIPCKGIGDNLVFTWKQFDLSNNSRLANIYVKKDNPRRDAIVVEADGTLVGKETILPGFDNGYYQCFVKNAKGTAFSRKLRLQMTSKLYFRQNQLKCHIKVFKLFYTCKTIKVYQYTIGEEYTRIHGPYVTKKIVYCCYSFQNFNRLEQSRTFRLH